MRLKGIIAFFMVSGSFTLQAQERPMQFPKADSAAQILLSAPSMEFSIIWLKEATDPILQQRRRLQELMTQRARATLVNMPAVRRQDINKKAGPWRMTAGNTSADNWSTFPDRALDARIIRFPQPRHMQPDKRPLSVQRLEKLKN